MAIVKKVVISKKEKKLSNYPIYYINGESTNSLDDLVKVYLRDTIEDYDDDFNLKIDISINSNTRVKPSVKMNFQKQAFCCGIYELGSLIISPSFPNNELTKILDSISNSIRGRTLLLNTNGREASIAFEKALSNCKEWTLVKAFKNSNSGNTIKMWVSNND